jgi:hypothetical protein
MAVGGRYDMLMEQAWDKTYVSCTCCLLYVLGDLKSTKGFAVMSNCI